jgi:peptidoglycan hydrolase-like protein with peptidoglycan-binding domain
VSAYLRRMATAALVLPGLLLVPATAQARLGDRVLKLGKRGSDVRELQGYLDTAGYRVVPTGVYDRTTRNRVREFELDHGLGVNGVLTRTEAPRLRRVATAPPGYGGMAYNPGPPPGPAPAGLPIVPGNRARMLPDGRAAAPADAPAEVKAIIAAGNEIAKLPYKWGGGHASWRDTGYDCSGSVTYAFRTTFRRGPAPTFGYSNWGLPGEGSWITVYANSGHVYMVVAGLRFDTSGLRETGSRWTNRTRSYGSFVARHPPGF